MNVTIICDASYCPDTMIAGYAYWVASDRGKMGDDGVFRNRLGNNIAAEMMAVNTAIQDGLGAKLIQDFDNILIQTDCQGAIDAFLNYRDVRNDQESKIVSWYNELRSASKLSLCFKHVKAHTGCQATRSIVNGICDRKARKRMREARDSYNNRFIQMSTETEISYPTIAQDEVQ